MTVGSDNLNLRSWTHDSELSCAVVGAERDGRAPHDPAGLGDGARVLPRETRLRLACEHLSRDPDDHRGLVDPSAAFDTFAAAARALDRWYDTGCAGTRPRGRLRCHRPEPVPVSLQAAARLALRYVADPDGRPRPLRHADAF